MDTYFIAKIMPQFDLMEQFTMVKFVFALKHILKEEIFEDYSYELIVKFDENIIQALR